MGKQIMNPGIRCSIQLDNYIQMLGISQSNIIICRRITDALLSNTHIQDTVGTNIPMGWNWAKVQKFLVTSYSDLPSVCSQQVLWIMLFSQVKWSYVYVIRTGQKKKNAMCRPLNYLKDNRLQSGSPVYSFSLSEGEYVFQDSSVTNS